MIRLTKIFHFEMAHALSQYNGPCKNIHGHTYSLHVTIGVDKEPADYIPAPGILVDFKTIKKIVQENIIQVLDHSLLLSREYTEQNPACLALHNLIIFEADPSAENLLLYIRRQLSEFLPAGVSLKKLVLFETQDSYAEWEPDR